jgi:WD40 repeat protein
MFTIYGQNSFCVNSTMSNNIVTCEMTRHGVSDYNLIYWILIDRDYR